MSKYWIVLGDTRVNAAAQTCGDSMAVVHALGWLYGRRGADCDCDCCMIGLDCEWADHDPGPEEYRTSWLNAPRSALRTRSQYHG